MVTSMLLIKELLKLDIVPVAIIHVAVIGVRFDVILIQIWDNGTKG